MLVDYRVEATRPQGKADQIGYRQLPRIFQPRSACRVYTAGPFDSGSAIPEDAWHGYALGSERLVIYSALYFWMSLAFALLAQSLPLHLYACYLDGESVQELAEKYDLSSHWVQERIEAVRLTLTMQVRLKVNPRSSQFVGVNH